MIPTGSARGWRCRRQTRYRRERSNGIRLQVWKEFREHLHISINLYTVRTVRPSAKNLAYAWVVMMRYLLGSDGEPGICNRVKTFSQCIFTIRIEVRALQGFESKKEKGKSNFTCQCVCSKIVVVSSFDVQNIQEGNWRYRLVSPGRTQHQALNQKHDARSTIPAGLQSTEKHL